MLLAESTRLLSLLLVGLMHTFLQETGKRRNSDEMTRTLGIPWNRRGPCSFLTVS